MADTPTPDPQFLARANTLIQVANDQLDKGADRGPTSASFLYASSRFNAWVVACSAGTPERMRETREQTLDYFVKQYAAMLEENFDDYVRNFHTYMTPPAA